MNKKILKPIIIIPVCLFIVMILLGMFFAYRVPIETFIIIRAESGKSEDFVENFREDINGHYINIYNTIGREGCTDYIIGFNAPLMDILSYNSIAENSYVVDFLYEWETKTISALHHEM